MHRCSLAAGPFGICILPLEPRLGLAMVSGARVDIVCFGILSGGQVGIENFGIPAGVQIRIECPGTVSGVVIEAGIGGGFEAEVEDEIDGVPRWDIEYMEGEQHHLLLRRPLHQRTRKRGLHMFDYCWAKTHIVGWWEGRWR